MGLTKFLLLQTLTHIYDTPSLKYVPLSWSLKGISVKMIQNIIKMTKGNAHNKVWREGWHCWHYSSISQHPIPSHSIQFSPVSMHAFQLKGIINFMTLNEIDTNSDESLKTRYATWGRNVASLYSGGNFNNSELIVVFYLTSKNSRSVTTTVLLYGVWQFMSARIVERKC